MGFQHLLIFGREQRDGAKDKLEELQVQIGSFHVGTHFMHSFKKVFHQNGGKDRRWYVIGQEGVGHDLKCVIFVDSFHDKVNGLREYFSESLGIEQTEMEKKLA